MSEIRDKVKGKIGEVIDRYAGYSMQDDPDQWMRDQLEEILSIPELAIVDRDAELPRIVSIPPNPETHSQDYKDGYVDGQQVYQLIMQKVGYVKEIKDV